MLDKQDNKVWDDMVRHFGGVVDVGDKMGKHASILSNYKKRGYPLTSKLELMALAHERNHHLPSDLVTFKFRGKRYSVTVTPIK